MASASASVAVAKTANCPMPVPGMVDGLWMGKYNIFDPAEVKYVERTDFLKTICGHIDHEETLEDVIRKMKPAYGASTARLDVYELAQTYYKYKNKGARLPKFSRWVSGMFSGNAELAKILADEGQKAASRKIIMSVEAVDILRCADGPHFQSCFKKESPTINRDMVHQYTQWGQYQYMPVVIAEECPGIGIVYVNDDNGFMMGRQWMHHARIKSTGEDMIVLTTYGYGCLQGDNVARLLAKRGIKVAMGSYYDGHVGGNGDFLEVEYVGCLTKQCHHDLNTWSPNQKVRLVKPPF